MNKRSLLDAIFYFSVPNILYEGCLENAAGDTLTLALAGMSDKAVAMG
jgi:hypothetical protein